MEKYNEEKEDEEENVGEGSSTEDLVPKWVLVLWAIIPVELGFWAAGPSDYVAWRGLATRGRHLL